MLNKPTRYNLVAVGGTFDLLHLGHEALLSLAFSLGRRVLIGMTSDRMVATMSKKHHVKPFNVRAKRLLEYLEAEEWSKRARITKINDPFGPSTRRVNLEAIIVSSETKSNAIKINRIRRRNGLSPLSIHVVKPVLAQDGKPISSTRIRNGEIDRLGQIRKK